MKKNFVLILFLLYPIFAQDLHEVSLHIGGGLSTLAYDPTLGEQSYNFDKQFGFGYAFFVSPRFGFATGLELSFYSAEFKLNNLEMRYAAQDIDEKTDFEFRSKLSGYKEEQSAIMLQIPLMLQFQTNSKYSFYTMAGVKAAIPISGSYNGKGNVVNSGYYEEENREYADTSWNFRGFGTFNGRKVENDEDFKISLLASMEMGMKWRFADGLSLYTGAYFDYGLGNILKKRKNLPPMVEYNSENPPNFAINGIFNSQNGTSQAFVNKVIPMAIGLKLRLSTGLGVDYFAKKAEKESARDETKRLEAEKLQLGSTRSEAEILAAAEKARNEEEAKRLAAERARNEEEAKRLAAERTRNEEEAKRYAAEKAQFEQEIAYLAKEQPKEQIQIQKIEPETTLAPGSGEYVIQVAVVLEESRASSIVNSLKQNGFNAYYKKVNNPGKLTGTYYRIRVGYFSKMLEAEDFAKTKLQSYIGWWIDKSSNDTR